MRHLLLTFAGVLITLSSSTAVRSQGCATTLSPHFATYHSAYINGSTIHTSVSIQGYASVAPGPGCNMSVATHKVGAYNKISTTGGWSYSASGCPTCYFSTSNDQQFTGTPGTVLLWTWQGEPICSIVGVFPGGGGGSSNLPVVSAILSQKTSSTVTSDDSAAGAYQSATNTLTLGPIISTGGDPGCALGNETIAALSPATYTGTVTFSRVVLMENNYENSTLLGAQILNKIDNPGTVNMDSNPQSGTSAGKVYVVDAPGMLPLVVDSNTYRTRMNFAINAQLPDGTRVSPYYYYYVRTSCRRTGTNAFQFISDVAGDNSIAQGTTAMSWNLQ